MKRLDKNKIYAFIGRATVYTGIYIGILSMILWSFTRITVYR